jgi:hypothetical protein
MIKYKYTKMKANLSLEDPLCQSVAAATADVTFVTSATVGMGGRWKPEECELQTKSSPNKGLINILFSDQNADENKEVSIQQSSRKRKRESDDVDVIVTDKVTIAQLGVRDYWIEALPEDAKNWYDKSFGLPFDGTKARSKYYSFPNSDGYIQLHKNADGSVTEKVIPLLVLSGAMPDVKILKNMYNHICEKYSNIDDVYVLCPKYMALEKASIQSFEYDDIQIFKTESKNVGGESFIDCASRCALEESQIKVSSEMLETHEGFPELFSFNVVSADLYQHAVAESEGEKETDPKKRGKATLCTYGTKEVLMNALRNFDPTNDVTKKDKIQSLILLPVRALPHLYRYHLLNPVHKSEVKGQNLWLRYKSWKQLEIEKRSYQFGSYGHYCSSGSYGHYCSSGSYGHYCSSGSYRQTRRKTAY